MPAEDDEADAAAPAAKEAAPAPVEEDDDILGIDL